MGNLVETPPFTIDEFAGESLFIRGASGRLGQDLGRLSVACGLEVVTEPEDASYVALCTPSHVAENILREEIYKDKTVIDLSGAAKRNRIGEYGLMRTETEPWGGLFNTKANVYGNPGCIASAVILGLGAAGLSGDRLPGSISVVSVGGRSHAPDIDTGDIKLARRLSSHPHVKEIEKAFRRNVEVKSFMPVIADVPAGLMVTVHGRTMPNPDLDFGEENLSVKDVVGTHLLRHRLEIAPDQKDWKRKRAFYFPSEEETAHADFSLGIVIDNVRFVTTNAIKLIRYLKNVRNK